MLDREEPNVEARLQSLSPKVRDILVVLALIPERRVTRSKWEDYLRGAEIRNEENRKIYGDHFKLMVRALVDAGAVVYDNVRYEHAIAFEWLAPTLEDAHRRGELEAIAAALTSAMRHRLGFSHYPGAKPSIGVKGDLLLALVLGQEAEIRRLELRISPHAVADTYELAFFEVLGTHPSDSWIAGLSDEYRRFYLSDCLRVAFDQAQRVGGPVISAAVCSADVEVLGYLAIYHALAGEQPGALAALEACDEADARHRSPATTTSSTSSTEDNVLLSVRPELRASYGHERRVDEARRSRARRILAWPNAARAFVKLTQGEFEESRALFSAALSSKPARGRLTAQLPPSLAPFERLLAFTGPAPPLAREKSRARDASADVLLLDLAFDRLATFFVHGEAFSSGEHLCAVSDWAALLIDTLVDRWIGPKRLKSSRYIGRMFGETEGSDKATRQKAIAAHASKNGFVWIADQFRSLGLANASADSHVATRPSESTNQALVALFKEKERWQIVIDRIAHSMEEERAAEAAREKKSGQRPADRGGAELWWEVSIQGDWLEIAPYLTTLRGPKGKQVSLTRISGDSSLPVDEHDRRIASALSRDRGRGETARYAPLPAIRHLIGHPRVRNVAGIPMRVEEGEAKLRVEPLRDGGGVRLVLAPSDFHGGVAVETHDALTDHPRVVVTTCPSIVERILPVVGKGIDVPSHGVAEVLPVIGLLSTMVAVDTSSVNPQWLTPERGQGTGTKSAAGEGAKAGAQNTAIAAVTIPGDPRIHVQLFRSGASVLRFRLRVVPGQSAAARNTEAKSSHGPELRPGAPPAEIVLASTIADDEKDAPADFVRVARDLDLEKRNLALVLGACPTLSSLPRDGEDHVARELESCLEALLELGGVPRELIVISWREGRPLNVPGLRTQSDMRIAMTTERQKRAGKAKGSVSEIGAWFTLQGSLRIDDHRVLEMRQLMAVSSRAIGRFVPVSEDEWLALSEDVSAKLTSLSRLNRLGIEQGPDPRKKSVANEEAPGSGPTNDGARPSTILPIALLATVEGILEGTHLSLDSALTRFKDKLEAAEALTPPLPRDLGTELRDYQREGFEFLVRRTAAGVGACLADDMGLGKTVQALALLLHRASMGSTLIVAPTSVCRNWQSEARRFAPSLRIHFLADEGDRLGCIQKSKEGDVILASYGLLVSEVAALAGHRFGTVIFDEAHALKNASTQRAQAARELQAGVKVALTGTPIENHVGELHALFDLLVPGLLGTRKAFDAAFGAEVARGNREVSQQLRRVIRPFVLRRTKGQVLSELPPKTEMVRIVRPTAAHHAFYEAARQRVVEHLNAESPKTRRPFTAAPRSERATNKIELLSELMRLRRAAIDPRLVAGTDAPPGAKLDTLIEILVELREENHRALVFSQFLEVLDLVKERLDALQIDSRRLDGTMTADARAKEVEAFQSGKGDVFLLSLKAGGVGMNLTGADFVILLDPWWNPAVEDQAADRAHRIGQARPVTVIRLVTEATIEEKVLALQQEKKQVYADVIADSDGRGKLDFDVLTSLLEAIPLSGTAP